MNYIICNIRKALIKSLGVRTAKRLSSRLDTLKLNLGCGSVSHSDFIGIDLHKAADLQWDLRWGLPFSDNSVQEIRSDHLFEHLEITFMVELLKECRRVLVHGGILDFSIPHFDPYLEAYIKRDFEFLKEKIFDIPPRDESIYNTCFDRISWLLLRNGEHKSLFDKDSILSKVRFAGFSDISTRKYNPSRDINNRYSSIYVVAVK